MYEQEKICKCLNVGVKIFFNGLNRLRRDLRYFDRITGLSGFLNIPISSL